MVLPRLASRLGMLMRAETLDDGRAGSASRVAAQCSLVLLALVVDLLLWGFDTQLRFGLGEVSVGLVVITSLAVFGSLLGRRRRPRLVFALAWSYSMLWSLLLPTYQPFTALLIALYTIARHLRLREGLGFLLATIPVWIVATYNTATSTAQAPAGTAVTALIWCVMAGLVWISGRYGYRAEQNAQLREAMHRTEAELAVQNERLRVAREVHDIVSHSVSAMTLQAAGTRRAAPDGGPQVLRALEAIEVTGTQAMRDLRRLLGLLHGSGNSDARTPLCDRLGMLVDTVRRCGISATLDSDGVPQPLHPEIEHAAYRVLQEAFTNVIKHGGAGATLNAALTWRPGELSVVVRSHSTGNAVLAAAPASGFGLRGLDDRVRALGGSLQAGSDGSRSFLVTAVFPVEPGALRGSDGQGVDTMHPLHAAEGSANWK